MVGTFYVSAEAISECVFFFSALECQATEIRRERIVRVIGRRDYVSRE